MCDTYEKSNSSDFLKIYDISTDEIIPNGSIFNYDSDDADVIMDKKVKSKFKIDTKECFYNGGIIENTFFKDRLIKEMEVLLDANCDNSYSDKLKFETFCNHNWLLSFVFIHKYYDNIIGRSKIKYTIIPSLNIGNHNNGFIAGLHYYFYHSNISEISNNFKHNSIPWLGIDCVNNKQHKCYKKISKYLHKNKQNIDEFIIHGYLDDNILCYKNFMHVKTTVENKFGTLKILYNNIKPTLTNNILILLAILSLKTLHKNGIILTKILEPEYWDTNFQHQILLLSLIFNNSNIFRFPICKHGKVYFRYYLVLYQKKKLIYDDIVYKKLIYAYNNIKHIYINDSIMQLDKIKQWQELLQNVKNNYIETIVNPIDILYNIIEKMHDVI